MKGNRVFRKELGADHHALIPTGKKIMLEKLTADERKVMELILARFTAAFLPAANGEKRTVITRVELYDFLSQSSQIIVSGWKDVDGMPAMNTSLPELAVGDTRTVKVANVKTHVTEPPKPHTDASLLNVMEHAGKLVDDERLAAAMNKHGLGTPATRAAILERIIQVGYAQRRGKTILPTQKGIRFIELVPEALANAELTGKWEHGLNLIAEKRVPDPAFVERFMTGVTKLTADLVSAVKADAREGGLPEEERRSGKRGNSQRSTIGVSCPLCAKGNVTENDRTFGCSRWKQGCSFTIWKNAFVRYGGPMLNRKIIVPLIKDGQVRGSTGTIVLTGKTIKFQFTDITKESPLISIEYKH